MCDFCPDYVDTYSFTPSTGRDLYNEMYPKMVPLEYMPQTPSREMVLLQLADLRDQATDTLRDEGFEEDVRLMIHFEDEHQVAVEFPTSRDLEDFKESLGGALDEFDAIVAGPLVIPGRRVSQIRFASVRTVVEYDQYDGTVPSVGIR